MRTQITLGALLLASLAACTNASVKGGVPDDQLGDLTAADEVKADLPQTTVKLLGSLTYGQTSASVTYTGRSLAYQFTGNVNDKVVIDVKSSDGDAYAFLYNDDKKRLAYNDDTSSSNTDSHISFTLTSNKSASDHTYYIVFRDYDYSRAHFTVSLKGPSNYLSCHTDADCIAVPREACCSNGFKDAVNKNDVAAYRAANKCTTPHPICPLFLILDRRVAECNTGTQQCEMVEPQGQRCGGFTTNPHHCAAGYECILSHIPDVPGVCDQKCKTSLSACTCDDSNASPIDDPTDSCDPAHGGADCPQVCALP